mmetsp:Transcript_16890/g.50429  ORF Transcript_16890/g.50429 Transcript_16890/m.50429 type:complete len:263 (-) Transcript_16890:1593-2381(-)
MMAWEASARSTSDTVIWLAVFSRNRSSTESWGSVDSAALTASRVPDASVLRMMLRRWTVSASSSIEAHDLVVTRLPPPAVAANRSTRSASSAAWAALRASVSSAHTKNSSPAVGTALRPDIWTASEGVADSTSPVDSVSVLTLPKAQPATTTSPTRRVPACTSSVATAPLRLSRCASMMVPRAARLGFATSSATSACSRISSSRSSTPCPCFAEIGTIGMDPPHSSGMTPMSASSCLTRSGAASGLSTLLMAMMIGTSAALA